MINFISILISVGFGYLFFRIARPKDESGSKSLYFARTFLAWSLFASTSFYIRPFVVDQSLNNIIYWFWMSAPFAVVAVVVGFLYGKFR
tara:strand:- start:65 stop:331 length:267 start_codon:yes stop_codon:yes gene_type:complete